MDYEFTRNDYNEPLAVFSIGHEAIGHFLSIEIGDSVTKCDELQSVIQQLEQKQIMTHHYIGKEYQIDLNDHSVEILGLSLAFDTDEELPEDTELYDQEHQAECGFHDFYLILKEWRLFIKK